MKAAAVVQVYPLARGYGTGRFADGESIFHDTVALDKAAQRYLVACWDRLRSRCFDCFAVAANDDERARLCIAQKGGDIVVSVDPKCICSRCSHRIP